MKSIKNNLMGLLEEVFSVAVYSALIFIAVLLLTR
ncbi:MAG: hypothetical protein BWY37_00408 [Firmicutes bacterium ADurb.Bin262]|nr:MAG: hypothetical protein BWY37_00408 [Firmicutes bacterium ADurb.Bin262]